MYGYAMIMKLEFTLIVCTTITMFLMYPGVSWNLWVSIRRKWMLHKTKVLDRKHRHAEEKLKKYWEIDLRKLR